MNKQEQVECILEAVANCRALVMDAVEQELIGSPRWGFLRSRLLKYMGERGLEQQVRSILEQRNEELGGVK